MQDKEKACRDTNLGIVMEAHKQFTSLLMWLGKATPEGQEQVMQHVQHHDYIIQELNRLVEVLPQQKEVGMEQSEYERYKAAIKKMHDFKQLPKSKHC